MIVTTGRHVYLRSRRDRSRARRAARPLTPTGRADWTARERGPLMSVRRFLARPATDIGFRPAAGRVGWLAKLICDDSLG